MGCGLFYSSNELTNLTKVQQYDGLLMPASLTAFTRNCAQSLARIFMGYKRVSDIPLFLHLRSHFSRYSMIYLVTGVPPLFRGA